MAKNIYDEDIQITDLNIDWAGDENTGGKPLSGRVVQKFIKDNIINLNDRADTAKSRLDALNNNGAGIIPDLSARVTSAENRLDAIDDESNGALKDITDRIDSTENRLDAIDDESNGALKDITDRIDSTENRLDAIDY